MSENRLAKFRDEDMLSVGRGDSGGLKAWAKLWPNLNEAQRRWCAGQKAIELGWGGITRVQEVTGMSRPTIVKGSTRSAP